MYEVLAAAATNHRLCNKWHDDDKKNYIFFFIIGIYEINSVFLSFLVKTVYYLKFLLNVINFIFK